MPGMVPSLVGPAGPTLFRRLSARLRPSRGLAQCPRHVGQHVRSERVQHRPYISRHEGRSTTARQVINARRRGGERHTRGNPVLTPVGSSPSETWPSPSASRSN